MVGFIAHKCRGIKWRPYGNELCSLCHEGMESYNIIFINKEEYEKYEKLTMGEIIK
jgi:hypothetical protein